MAKSQQSERFRVNAGTGIALSFILRHHKPAMAPSNLALLPELVLGYLRFVTANFL